LTWIRRHWQRLKALLLDQLHQGTQPGRLALACALGLWLGLMPTLGASTVLCAVLALWLGLNQPAIQAANYLAYPLQILCLIPFLNAGGQVFNGPYPSLSAAEFYHRMSAEPLVLLREYAWMLAHGTVVWAALGLAVVPVLWVGLRWLFQRSLTRHHSR
jgi:uncharacterized protein (DUF2062 family)